MRPKDYYQTLEVLPADSVTEIKKKFRRLAMHYHPDKNMSDPLAAAKFVEIKEAYTILKDPVRRKAYDEERWISGIIETARTQQIVTPAWIMQEATRLRRHMKSVDTYRMDHAALRDYVLLLLSDDHVDVLRKSGDKDLYRQLVRELLAATGKLKAAYLQPVIDRLLHMADGDSVALTAIRQTMAQRNSQANWERYFPFVVLLIAVLVCWGILIISH